MKRAILSICLIFVLYLESICQGKESEINKTYNESILPVLSDLKIYGTFSTNYRSFSDQYALNFRRLFHDDALMINFFTLENTSVASYTDFVKKMFINGFFFDLIIDGFESRDDLIPNVKEFKVNAKVKVDGIDSDQKRYVFERDVQIILTAYDNSKYFKIRSIKLLMDNFIDKIIVQVIDIDNINKPPVGIELELYIHDIVFQRNRTDETGTTTFVGLPMRDTYFVRVTKNQDIQCQPIKIIPKLSLYSWPIYTLPIKQKTKLFPAIYLGTEFGIVNKSFDFSKQNDTSVSKKINHFGYENSYSFGFSKSLVYRRGFSLIGSVGLEMHYNYLTLKKIQLSHEIRTKDIDNDSVMVTIDIKDGQIVSRSTYFGLPISLAALQEKNNKNIFAYEFALRFRPLISLQSYNNRRFLVSTKGYYPQYDLTLEDLPAYNYYIEREISNNTNFTINRLLYGYGFSFGLFFEPTKSSFKSKLTFNISCLKQSKSNLRPSDVFSLSTIDPFNEWMKFRGLHMYSVDINLFIPY